MKCSRPSPPGFSRSSCAWTTAPSWSRPACSSTPIDTTLSYWPSASRKSASRTLSLSSRPRRAISLRNQSSCSVVVLIPVPAAPSVSQARNRKPPKPQPMSTKRSPRELDLAADMVDLARLCLLQCLRAFGPVAAGVHHQRVVQPQTIERCPQAIVSACIGFGLRQAVVGIAQLMDAVLHIDQGLALHVQATEQAGRQCRAEIAFDVDALVEI